MRLGMFETILAAYRVATAYLRSIKSIFYNAIEDFTALRPTAIQMKIKFKIANIFSGLPVDNIAIKKFPFT